MDMIKKIGKEDRAELTLFSDPHGSIPFSPPLAIAVDHLERSSGKHLAATRE